MSLLDANKSLNTCVIFRKSEVDINFGISCYFVFEIFLESLESIGNFCNLSRFFIIPPESWESLESYKDLNEIPQSLDSRVTESSFLLLQKITYFLCECRGQDHLRDVKHLLEDSKFGPWKINSRNWVLFPRFPLFLSFFYLV